MCGGGVLRWENILEFPDARKLCAYPGLLPDAPGAGIMTVAAKNSVQAGRVSAVSANWALFSLSLSMLLSSLGTSIANVGLPTFARVFSASFQEVQWIVIVYLLAITTSIVSVGRLGDMFGRRRLLLAGISMFTLASLACALAPSLWVLLAGRALQGLGSAVMMALTMAFVADAVPKERTGSAMGILGTMSAVGTALGPSLGGVLLSSFGWQAMFLINAPLGLLAVLLAARYLPKDKARSGARQGFDVPGTVLLGLSLAAYALAMTLGRGSFGWLNVGLLLAAGVGGLAFYWVESRVTAPLVRFAMFRDPGLGLGFASSLIVSTVMMTTLVVGPFYLSKTLGLEPVWVGAVMAVGPFVAALVGIPAGRLVDAFGSGKVTIAGLLGITAGATTMVLVPSSVGMIGYAVPLATITASYALFQAANNTGVMKNARAELRGVVSGLLNLSRNLGLITGASAMGAVFSLAIANTDLALVTPQAISFGMRVTFGVAALLVVGALVLIVGVKRKDTQATYVG